MGARALAGLGLGLSVAYLVWRAGWTMHDSRWWLAAPLYAVELTGVLGAFALAWALWPHPELPGTG
ncbi:MAG TPA: hypothetical protein DCR14_06815, partial [Acidimicrobiaceae bacterium]|nr:hypothetical protein [Acidimicrobiaceae bacterium]